MKKNKFYFESESSEICYPASGFDDGAEVYEAIPVRWNGIFWCKTHCFCGDKGEATCGVANCKEYSPRNGKSGCCKHYTTKLYEPGGKVIIKHKK